YPPTPPRPPSCPLLLKNPIQRTMKQRLGHCLRRTATLAAGLQSQSAPPPHHRRRRHPRCARRLPMTSLPLPTRRTMRMLLPRSPPHPESPAAP
ncbi:hypothetical protein DXG03_004422, partial [Asterophora parasitica]